MYILRNVGGEISSAILSQESYCAQEMFPCCLFNSGWQELVGQKAKETHLRLIQVYVHILQTGCRQVQLENKKLKVLWFIKQANVFPIKGGNNKRG